MDTIKIGTHITTEDISAHTCLNHNNESHSNTLSRNNVKYSLRLSE